MGTGADRALQLRRQAWAYGRGRRDDLLRQFCDTYDLFDPPPPALCIDELLTDFLGTKLRFDPLPFDRFAQTTVVDGQVVVTINSLTNKMAGVKDADGVQNVAKWHEAIHVLDDQEQLRRPATNLLPGFGSSPTFVCLRAGDRPRQVGFDRCEFWAEEAGRAAAVSHDALARSRAFQRLLSTSAADAHGEARAGWPCLYEAARDIGVNITALTKQLELEGRLALVKTWNGASRVFVPRTFLTEEAWT